MTSLRRTVSVMQQGGKEVEERNPDFHRLLLNPSEVHRVLLSTSAFSLLAFGTTINKLSSAWKHGAAYLCTHSE